MAKTIIYYRDLYPTNVGACFSLGGLCPYAKMYIYNVLLVLVLVSAFNLAGWAGITN